MKVCHLTLACQFLTASIDSHSMLFCACRDARAPTDQTDQCHQPWCCLPCYIPNEPMTIIGLTHRPLALEQATEISTCVTFAQPLLLVHDWIPFSAVTGLATLIATFVTFAQLPWPARGQLLALTEAQLWEWCFGRPALLSLRHAFAAPTTAPLSGWQLDAYPSFVAYSVLFPKGHPEHYLVIHLLEQPSARS